MQEDNKQNVAIAVLQTQMEIIDKKLEKGIDELKVLMSDWKVSNNGKLRMLDDRITNETGENKKLIDNHCARIRANEQFIKSLEPVKNLYDKAAIASLGIMITLGLTVIGVAYTLAEKLKQ
jgi:hypothetical protein